nr:pentatricopeptide repeat-containing protein At1g11290, chloroplastic [Ipomoea batatas]
MSFQLLATTSTAPAPPPLPPSLAPRTHIPSHVYTHPAAILLELCTSVKELRQMLPIVIKNGLYNELLFQTKLISLFSKYGSLNEAAKVFEPINPKQDALYHTMLEGHIHHSSLDSSFSFYSRMRSDNVTPVVYNLTYLLKACADNSDIQKEPSLSLLCLPGRNRGRREELMLRAAVVGSSSCIGVRRCTTKVAGEERQ